MKTSIRIVLSLIFFMGVFNFAYLDQARCAHWEWQNPIPTGNNLQDVWRSPDGSDVFAVGGNGTILRYNGSAWDTMESGVLTDLYGVWGTSSSDVFAVGSSGIILHYDGNAWIQQTSNTTSYLYDVWGSSGSDVWAVGTSGRLLHYDGSNWTETIDPSNATFQGVWGSAVNNVYAVGSAGTIVHWTGSVWAPEASGTTQYLYGVWGIGTVVYAVGGSGTILNFIPGVGWEPRTSGTLQTLQNVWGTSVSNVIAIGNSGTTLRFDGAAWNPDNSGSTATLSGISSLDGAANDIYVVGTNGSILQYNGSAWSPFAASSVASVTLNDIWGSSSTDIFAVGYTGTILRSDGTTWSQEVSNTTENLEAVWGSSGSDVFAVGWNGTVARYNGSNWTASAPVAVRLNDVWGSSGSDVFAVGDTGTILHWNGSAWTAMTSGTVENMNGVWGSSSSDVYAVGTYDGGLGMGTVLHYDGSAWSQVLNIPINDELFDIWGSGPDNIYVVGYGGAIMHYDGTAWRQIESRGYDLEAVWGTAADDVYILDSIDLFHYDGYVWSPVSMPSNSANSIWGSSADDVYLVTGQGGIVHFVVDTFYVDMARPDNTGDGTSLGTAWKTLHYAINEINAMQAGNYKLIVNGGIYSPANGEVDEVLMITQDNASLVGLAGAVLEGRLGLDNIWANGLEIDASNVRVRNLEIRAFFDETRLGVRITGGDNIAVEDCDIHNNNNGIGIDGTAGSDVFVVGCTIFDHNEYGIAVDDNSPEIFSNTIYDNARGISINEFSSNNITPSIYNNLIFDIGSVMQYGIYMSAFSTGATISAKINHNTIDGGGGGTDGIYITQEETPVTFDIKYNIITNFGGYGIRDASTTPINPLLDYNNVFNPSGTGRYLNMTAGTNDISFNPLYMNYPVYDFHLQTGSPCEDVIPLSGESKLAFDLDGSTRPQGIGYDMGAYESPGSAEDLDSDGDGVLDSQDGCPFDADKIAPGQCGCGVMDADVDMDGLADCVDVYPDSSDNRPIQVSPANGLIIPVGVDVTLVSSGFQPAGDVNHVLTYWQVWRSDNGEMIAGIPTTDLTETILASGLLDEGLQYTWRVGYEDSEPLVSWSLEQTFIIGTSETDETVQVTSGTDIAAYKMVSFVQWPDDPRAETVFGDEMAFDYDGNYRIGTYNAGRGAYDEYGTGRLMVAPGRGYWFLAREGLDTVVDGVPVSLSTEVFIALDYNPDTQDGWNMVGPPNGADYLWGDVQVVEDVAGTLTPRGTVQGLLEDNPYLDRKLWRWEGGAYASDTPDTDAAFRMAAYEGYWVKAKQANIYLRFDPGTQIAALDQTDTLLARTWHKASTLLSVLNIFSQEAVADNDTPPMPMGGLDENTVDPVFQGCFIEITDDFNGF